MSVDTNREERRLAAIMFTDMVGYTALTQSNESLALEILDRHNRLLRPIISKYRGKEIKTIGDSFLVEFDSAVDAVKCAIEIQTFLRDYNTSSGEEWRIKLRIGIHLGDVVHKQGDIFGDAVNIASRVEPLASPEGICVSEQVFDQVRNKVSYQFSKLEEKELKNVRYNIDVFKMIMPWDSLATSFQDKKLVPSNRIAVLPFTNISPDPSDEYFADGMTEEIIDRLSQVKGLRVIARTSVMNYKKKERKVSEIGSELGVQTLVQGSVRKAGNKIRVTAQLIDTATEEHLWSSRYDKDLDDIFAVQSDIASSIIKSLPTSVTNEKIPLSKERDTDNITAYSYFLRARQLNYQNTESSLLEALSLYEEAIKLDHSFTRAYADMGELYIELGTKSILTYDQSMSGAHSAAKKALEINPDLAEVHALLSRIAWVEDDFVTGEKEANLAIEINPSFSDGHNMLAFIKASKGYPNEAIKNFEMANELDPLDPVPIRFLGHMYVFMGRVKEAEDFWTRNRLIDPFEVARIKAYYYLIKADYRAAEKEIEFLEKLRPEYIVVIAMRGFLSALTGNRKKAEETLILLDQKFKGKGTAHRFVGYMKYFLGDMDGYFDAMFKCVETHVLDPMVFRYSPLFERARKDPRYRQVLIKNGLDPDLKE